MHLTSPENKGSLRSNETEIAKQVLSANLLNNVGLLVTLGPAMAVQETFSADREPDITRKQTFYNCVAFWMVWDQPITPHSSILDFPGIRVQSLVTLVECWVSQDQKAGAGVSSSISMI